MREQSRWDARTSKHGKCTYSWFINVPEASVISACFLGEIGAWSHCMMSCNCVILFGRK
jgi:hypothetical protein